MAGRGSRKAALGDVALSDMPPRAVSDDDPTISEAERLHAQRKCKRCGALYTVASGDKCYYHTRPYHDPSDILAGTRVGWLCCNVSETLPGGIVVFNEPARERHCRGCTVADSHDEDVEYTRVLRHFPFDPNAKPMFSPPSPPPPEHPSPPAAAAAAIERPSTPEGFVRHPVAKSDTLAGVALRYGVPVAELKTANRIPPFSSQIFHLRELLVPVGGESGAGPGPVSPEETRTQMQRRFKNQAKCSIEEAKYYLEQSNYDFDKALRLYQDDSTFERTSPNVSSGRVESPKSGTSGDAETLNNDAPPDVKKKKKSIFGLGKSKKKDPVAKKVD